MSEIHVDLEEMEPLDDVTADIAAIAAQTQSALGDSAFSLEMWGGADTDGYIWSLRWLGTEEEAVAARTEEMFNSSFDRERPAP